MLRTTLCLALILLAVVLVVPDSLGLFLSTLRSWLALLSTLWHELLVLFRFA